MYRSEIEIAIFSIPPVLLWMGKVSQEYHIISIHASESERLRVRVRVRVRVACVVVTD